MKKIFLHSPGQQNEWLTALRAELPMVEISGDVNLREGVDYGVVWNPPAQSLDLLRTTKAIFAMGAGVDRLLPLFPNSTDPPIIRIEDGGMADSMEEYALYVVLEKFRDFRTYEILQEQKKWKPMVPKERSEFGVGILGLGALGRKVALCLGAMDFQVYGWSRNPKELPGIRTLTGRSGLKEVLQNSRVLILLLPLTKDTRCLLNADTLGYLPQGSVVVNLARGPLISDLDLIAALDSGHLDLAYLDVFDPEPLPQDHRFWNHGKIRITPHVAAQTQIGPAARQIGEKIRLLEQGNRVTGVVDPFLGY